MDIGLQTIQSHLFPETALRARASCNEYKLFVILFIYSRGRSQSQYKSSTVFRTMLPPKWNYREDYFLYSPECYFQFKWYLSRLAYLLSGIVPGLISCTRGYHWITGAITTPSLQYQLPLRACALHKQNLLCIHCISIWPCLDKIILPQVKVCTENWLLSKFYDDILYIGNLLFQWFQDILSKLWYTDGCVYFHLGLVVWFVSTYNLKLGLQSRSVLAGQLTELLIFISPIWNITGKRQCVRQLLEVFLCLFSLINRVSFKFVIVRLTLQWLLQWLDEH